MPHKPKRPCSYPGCPNLTDSRFCPEHKQLDSKLYNKYNRTPEAKKRYGRAWKRIRDSYIADHPFCEMCLADGVYRAAEEIHHRTPLADGGTNSRENLQSLCKSHHSSHHLSMRNRTR